jgi:cell division septation protein DedD
MLSDLGKPCWRNLRRRLISAVTLLGYLVAAIGFPVPESKASSNPCGERVCCCGSEATCQASGCGCPDSPLAPHVELAPQEAPVVDGRSPAPHTPAAPRSCCSKSTSESTKPSVAPTGTPSKAQGNAFRWVVGIAALKCKGISTSWLSSGAALPSTVPFCWQPMWPYCHSLPITHHFPVVRGQKPVDPPPRLQAA